MKSIFIIGPSGSGKSTLSQHLAQVYKSIFNPNSVLLINLDPANPSQQKNNYDIDLNNLITIEDIMEEFEIGPNGAMIYAMQFLEENKQWLIESIKKQLIKKQPYFKVKFSPQNIKQHKFQQYTQLTSPFTLIFDLPGQIQLYLHNNSMKTIIQTISQTFTQNKILLELFDSTYIYNLNDFISLCMMSLVSMINFQMPHINILNKIDVLKGERPALGMLNDYFDICSVRGIVQDLTFIDDEQKSTPSIIKPLSEILDQYNQVSYIPCSVYKLDLIKYLIIQIQSSFGYHQIFKNSNTKYSQFIKSVDRTMIKQELITELQNQLFREDEEEQQQQINKFMSQMQKDMQKPQRK